MQISYIISLLVKYSGKIVLHACDTIEHPQRQILNLEV